MGKVYLTGAGPGDFELMTIKALRVIKDADIIIYDRLANPDILKEAKTNAKLVYVGKEKGIHSVPQDRINEILYQAALDYENVVRLKGGDNFVFGRGGEEAIYLFDRNIKFEVIPGITSSIAVPAYAGIPVTHRGITTSFRVVTGHESPEKEVSQVDWQSFKTNETIIFLMGFHHLSKITKKLLEIGKPKDYPCAIISKGTTKEQKVAVGTLENIVEKSKGMETPALIVVGEVVKLREKLKWLNEE